MIRIVRRSANEIGNGWEEYVKAFFRKMGFENVDGGSGFNPGDAEDIDIVAGKNNVLYIGECKAKAEVGKSNLGKGIILPSLKPTGVGRG